MALSQIAIELGHGVRFEVGERLAQRCLRPLHGLNRRSDVALLHAQHHGGRIAGKTVVIIELPRHQPSDFRLLRQLLELMSSGAEGLRLLIQRLECALVIRRNGKLQGLFEARYRG